MWGSKLSDWAELFIPSVSPLEMFVRGTIIYLSLLVLMRLFRRQTGTLGPADMVVLLLIANAAQNAMIRNYESITDGLWIVIVIVGWEYVLDMLSYYFPGIRHRIERSPLLLIDNGKIVEKHLAKELITLDELNSLLRQQGVDNLQSIKKSYMEGNGHISVLNCEPLPPIKPDSGTSTEPA